MELKILGCHGGESPKHRSTCFLLNEHLAIDAGALTSGLELDKQAEVDHVLITHSHFDHVKDLATLADNIFGRRKKPVYVYSTRTTLRTLKRDFFNNRLWPDFTVLPNERSPTLKLVELPFNETVRIGQYRVMAVPVTHPVESVGYLVRDPSGTLAISGDTGPTERFWEAVNQAKDLRALLVEVSFPNSMQTLADVSKHLTPATLRTELRKVTQDGFPVMLYHLKPAFIPHIQRDLEPLLKERELVVPSLDDLYRL